MSENNDILHTQTHFINNCLNKVFIIAQKNNKVNWCNLLFRFCVNFSEVGRSQFVNYNRQDNFIDSIDINFLYTRGMHGWFGSVLP